MSKILEVRKCGSCNHFFRGNCTAGITSELVNYYSISPNCPLKDSDAWKKELLEWIEKESEKYYPVNPDETRKIAIVNTMRMVKQKIQEM